MYVVKDYATKKLLSWHQETKLGLRNAIEEAEMRTHGFNRAHVVHDNHGLQLHLALPKEVAKRLAEQRASRGDWLVPLATIVALIIFGLLKR